MKFDSKTILLVVLVAFFLSIIGYNVLGNSMEGFKEGATESSTDSKKFTTQNITDIIKCADPNGNKSPYSGSDILSMLGGTDIYSISDGKVTCKKSDSEKSDSKKSDSKKSDSTDSGSSSN
jgi:hypothetical protein